MTRCPISFEMDVAPVLMDDIEKKDRSNPDCGVLGRAALLACTEKKRHTKLSQS